VSDLRSMLVLTPVALDELLWKKLSTDRVALNTDDNLKSEYSLPYQVISKDDRIEKNLELLRSFRFNLLACLSNMPVDASQKAEFIDRVALSMAGFSQKHPGEGLDDAALAAAYEAWTISESPATASACDVVSYMTGRIGTEREAATAAVQVEALTPSQAFWVGQAEALKGNKARAIEVIRQGIARAGGKNHELNDLLEKLTQRR
jgi:hypothetical protein